MRVPIERIGNAVVHRRVVGTVDGAQLRQRHRLQFRRGLGTLDDSVIRNAGGLDGSLGLADDEIELRMGLPDAGHGLDGQVLVGVVIPDEIAPFAFLQFQGRTHVAVVFGIERRAGLALFPGAEGGVEVVLGLVFVQFLVSDGRISRLVVGRPAGNVLDILVEHIEIALAAGKFFHFFGIDTGENGLFHCF